MKIWQKVRLYQKGLILGIFAPMITVLLALIGAKAFEYSNIPGDIAGSPLMLLGIIYFLSGKVWISCLWWGLICGIIGFILELCEINLFVFRIAKYIIGSIPIIFAGVFFRYSLDEFIYISTLLSLMYPSILLMIILLHIAIGIAICRMKPSKRDG